MTASGWRSEVINSSHIPITVVGRREEREGGRRKANTQISANEPGEV